MDQSESSSSSVSAIKSPLDLRPPRRGITLEFMVGIFALLGVAAAGYLSIGLGGLELMGTDDYVVYAEFDNISGLKKGASVEIAGVQIGSVANITLKDPAALVEMRLNRNVKLRDDDIASIRTKGIIGDRYVKISRGGSETFVGEGETVMDTESVVDIEDIIGKVVHSLGGDKDEEEGEEKKVPDANRQKIDLEH